jgi:hypothetical protein
MGKTGHAVTWAFSICGTNGAIKAYPALVYSPTILLILPLIVTEKLIGCKKVSNRL